MEFTHEGKKYSWNGTYRKLRVGDWFLGTTGSVTRANQVITENAFAIVEPVLETVEWAGVVWEVLETRVAKPGEMATYVVAAGVSKVYEVSLDTPVPVTIVRPLRLVEPRP